MKMRGVQVDRITIQHWGYEPKDSFF